MSRDCTQTNLCIPLKFVRKMKSAFGGGGGGAPYITDGDARRNFQKQPLKVTILGMTLANFIP